MSVFEGILEVKDATFWVLCGYFKNKLQSFRIKLLCLLKKEKKSCHVNFN